MGGKNTGNLGRTRRLLYFLTAILGNVLMSNALILISGFGELLSERWFVELYTYDDISNFEEYSIEASRYMYMPNTSITRKSYVLLTNNDPTIGAFFGNKYTYIHGYNEKPYVVLRHGNDKINLLHRNITVDRYGDPGPTKNMCNETYSCVSYRRGWVKRSYASLPTTTFKQHEWIVTVNAFDQASSNDACIEPFPVKSPIDGKAEYVL